MGMNLSNIGELRRTVADKPPLLTCKFARRDTSANAPEQSSEPSVGGSNPSSRTTERRAREQLFPTFHDRWASSSGSVEGFPRFPSTLTRLKMMDVFPPLDSIVLTPHRS
jgi:hypothetical protein